ncbi:MAG: hypothetical protein QXQ94_03905 [Candidatus Bathyarchaeia archaeon]
MKELVKKVKLLEPLDIEKITINRDHYFPNAYIIDLPLDSTPDHVWQDIFEREWKASRHLWDRKLFVMGDKLRLLTTLNNIEEKINWIKEVIDRTNKSIDEYHKDMEARASQIEEQLRKQMVDETAKIEKIRDTLRRRFTAI